MPAAPVPDMPYRGRFAPTPSGPLHLGSLVTALASYLAARHAGGAWLLRVDDIDGPRCRPEHADTILRQLDAHGLHWDEAVRYQSHYEGDYQAAFDTLRDQGRCYRCICTRARLAETSQPGVDGPVYAGTCRDTGHARVDSAWRLRVPHQAIALDDRIHGRIERDLARDIGDFVIRRADGRIGYQLASVVDEQQQGITDLVRGADLIGSSLRQKYLMQHFGFAVPGFLHIPVLLDGFGNKLSKQNHATPIHAAAAAQNLIRGLNLLGQAAFAADWHGRVDEILARAVRNWNPALIPRRLGLPA
ncbi:tRNA glutamyl-Q(34) synthetase GluQRS [Nevskia sp.]|uniref:tRNA glutamyl-Q(34) synthetase GluQRS n=1 Tax=Nevskia sp. TaxID=1929292 RepID=UPI0025F04DFD|nr:tRNA glutamyl-Q(34) synthetase GluQRS [Nevskia sp.]